MNTKQMKKIRNKARAIMVEWIKEVIKKEDHTKVNRENLEKLIETSSYYWSGGMLKLQPWSYRWIVKKLKKNPQWTLKDIKQSLAPSEQAQRRERMAKEGPIAFQGLVAEEVAPKKKAPVKVRCALPTRRGKLIASPFFILILLNHNHNFLLHLLL